MSAFSRIRIVGGGALCATLLFPAVSGMPGTEALAQDSVTVLNEELPPARRERPNRIELKVGLDPENEDAGFRIIIDDETTSSADLVRFGESVHVGADEHIVGDVVAIGGDITVEGKISGDCVAVGGNIHMFEGATATGDVVSVGGNLTLEDSTKVGGDAVSVWGVLDTAPSAKVYGTRSEVGGFGLNLPSGFLLGMPHPRGPVYDAWHFASRLIWVLILVGLGMLAFSIFPSRARRLAQTVEQRGAVAFLAGLAGWILWLPVFVLLCITVIGIPVAILLIFLTPLITLLGYLAVAEVTGRKLGGGAASTARAVFLGVLILEGGVLLGRIFGVFGAFFDMLGLALAVIGYCVIFIAATTGLGAILISRFRPVEPESAPSVPAAPPGSTLAAPPPAAPPPATT